MRRWKVGNEGRDKQEDESLKRYLFITGGGEVNVAAVAGN